MVIPVSLRLIEVRVIGVVAQDAFGLVLGAAKDVLDRGALKAADRVEVAASITVTRPWQFSRSGRGGIGQRTARSTR